MDEKSDIAREVLAARAGTARATQRSPGADRVAQEKARVSASGGFDAFSKAAAAHQG